MPMFQQATDFALDGTFQDVNGDQHNQTHSYPFSVQGSNNHTTFSPNHSRTENRISNHIRGVNIQGIVSPGGHNYIGVQHQSYSPPPMNRDQFPVDLFLAFLAANPQLQPTQNGVLLPDHLQRDLSHSTQQSSQYQYPPQPYQPHLHEDFIEPPLFRHSGPSPGPNESLVSSTLPYDPAISGLDAIQASPTPGPTAPPPVDHLSIASSVTLPSSYAGMNETVTLDPVPTQPPSTTAPQVISAANTTPAVGISTSLPVPSNTFFTKHESNLPDHGALKEGDSFSLLKPPDPSKRDSMAIPGMTPTEHGIGTRGTPRVTARKKRWQWLERLGLKKAEVRK